MKKRILTVLLAFVMIFSLLPVGALAASGTCGDDLTWTLDSQGTLTISGTGAMDDYLVSDVFTTAPWGRYCPSIKHVVISSGVTSIGNWAFAECSSLTSITLPDSVTSIGNWALAGCSSLTSITIPNGVTRIGDNVLSGCTHLTNISVLDNNNYYSSAEGVLFNKNQSALICYPNGKTESEYTIPKSVTSIGNWAFGGCSSLTSITIPDGVMSIDYCAFGGCSSLTSITIPDGVTIINNGTFDGCSSLTSITIPDSVTSIGGYAFCGCSSLTSITIPSSVTSIGEWAFENCSSLTSITLQDGLKSIGYYAFRGCIKLTSITIPNSVTSIGYYAFFDCSSLTSITLPNSMTNIGYGTFRDCSSLTSITIPASVTSIGDSAFDGCSSIKDVCYAGTSEQWAEISIGYGNEPLINAEIYYSHSNGHNYFKSSVIEPSCTEAGYTEHTCVYGDTMRDTFVPALGHTHDDGETGTVTLPTCADRGFTTYTCERCGEDYTADYTDVLEHSYITSVTAPTCEEKGYTTYTCSVCGYSYKDDYTDSLGHSVVVDEAVPASCTAPGKTDGTHCEHCGKVFIQQEIVTALGHELITDKEGTAASCTESGLTSAVHCSRCDYKTEQQTIPALGHDYQDEVTIPTCIERGYTTHTCKVCGDSYIDSYVDALGHKTEVKNAKAATCTEAGYTGDEVCTVCDVTVKNGETIAALGHDYQNTVTAPTCTEKGFTTHTCSCGYSYIDSYVDALGHKTELKNATPATCTESGYTGDEVCIVCKTVVQQGKTIDALGHSYVNGTCSVCGAKDPNYKPAVDSFTDVDVTGRHKPFADAILWAANEGITTGYGNGIFKPDADCTRAQVVTFLWRAAGEPAPKSTNNPFVDVAEKQANGKDNPYYTAILWAVGEGITLGVDKTHFAPDATVTRAQFVTFLWRYENKPEAKPGVTLKDLDTVTNADFKSAILWAAGEGITTGYSDGSFRPNAVCTRAHVVTFIYRDIA